MAAFSSNYRPIFLISFIPAFIGVLILQIFVSEGRVVQLKEKIKFGWNNFGPKYNLFLLVSVVFSLGNSSDAFLILRSKDLGMSAMLVILAYVVYNIFYAGFSYPAGVLADKIGFKKVLLIGFFVFGLDFLPIICYSWQNRNSSTGKSHEIRYTPPRGNRGNQAP